MARVPAAADVAARSWCSVTTALSTTLMRRSSADAPASTKGIPMTDAAGTAPSLSSRWTLDELRRVLTPLPAWHPPALGDDVRAAVVARAEGAAADAFPA